MSTTQDQGQDQGEPKFPIVGIGASAGGLKAVGTFLEHTPADSGMAFVLVFHLDPKHKSEAAALLQARTRMPVAQVEARVRIEPDHVYVIPPNHGLSLVDGDLTLTKRKRDEGRPTVIDHFFRALAEHTGERSIGIVLSGTGSEGSQGLKAIKEAGGLTVVQDEAEAEYSGMPHSAIATGMIDFVLPVARMAAKLIEIQGSTIDFAVPDGERADAASDPDLLQKIFVQLRTRVGHDFSHYKQSTILRRITRRMQVHQLQQLSAYLDLLRETPDETEALFRELLISVTNFFRDPDAMTALERDVIPQLCKRLEGHAVRVWVPGCATGEEAYSLAMLLSEACDGLASPPHLQIFATDVDERALDTARVGVYPDAIAGDVSEARMKRFFDREGDGFKVKPLLREMILFTRHDLLQDPPFSKLDLISCRNLLIYLKSDIQTKIFALFHFSLKPQSYLFLGSSESVGSAAKLFSEVDRKAKLFKSRRVPVTDMQFPLLPNGLRGGAQREEPDEPRKRFAEIVRDELLASYAPPCVIVDENYDVIYISGRVGKYLEPGSGAANYNILDMAREELRLTLRTALFKAFHGGEGVRGKPVSLRTGAGAQQVRLTVRPLPGSDGQMLVIFEEMAADESVPAPARAAGDDNMIAQLEAELSSTRESLQTSIEELETSNEELRASNEELQSMNEELQSTTEELETGKEELQSANEELLAVNQELQARNDDFVRVNSDLNNLISGTEIATLFLDEELRVRRYTPRATEIFNLIAGDVGRPFAHITHRLDDGELVADVERVLRDLTVVERELGSQAGRFYQIRLRPYRTTDNRVGGVVLTFVDVTERHTREAETEALNVQLEHQKRHSESIIATVREPLLVLDSELRVISANRAYYRGFNATPETVERRSLYELGDNDWDMPALRRLLDDMLLQHATIENFEIRHDFGAGERVVLLNAHHLRQRAGLAPLILLAFDDVTESIRHQELLAESENKYRSLFNSIDEGFCIIEMIFDANGKPVDFRYLETNPAFDRHATRAMQGQRIKELVPDFEQYWIDQYAEVAATGKPVHLENVVRGLGEQWFQTSAVRYGGEGSTKVAVLFTNITERKKTERAARHLASIVNSSDDAIISKNLQGVISTWNPAAERMFGYTAEEAVGQPITAVIIPADRQDEENDILRRIARGETIDHFETVRHRKDGGLVDVSVTISPLRDKHGEVVGASKIARDIGDHKRAQKHRQLLLNELNHRVKNTLSTVQSIAMQTLGGATGESERVWSFESRLMALAKTHNLLTRANWRSVALYELLAQELAPFAGSGRERFTIAGPNVELRPNAALALGMAFHELATNATKYGALSNAGGNIRVVTELVGADESRLRFTWTESGGPAVTQPTHRGFGTRLVSSGLAHELNGDVHLDYQPTGLVCRIEIPLVTDSGGGD